MANINKSALAKLSGVSVSDIESVFSHIVASVSNGDEVSIPKFGKFISALQKGRTGTVPGTTKTYTTSDSRVPKFRPSSSFKEYIAYGA